MRQVPLLGLEARNYGHSSQEAQMLYMVIEYFNSGAVPEIYRRAEEQGRMLPPGLEYVDSWVDTDYFRCFQLMRTDDPSLFSTWHEAWRDLGHVEVVPVQTSREAAQRVDAQESHETIFMSRPF
jgi:hypothetical protein